ncbi:aquaporin-like protein [Thelephora terrestris]|uniref:Aquaporin-like protein n=1 Tax=Thelephora terrestris TaxID=56493 RepID=A0A9P6HS24_9AGAM|nr:aquaporin-like protein [Thelephora terrestris]
MVASISFANIKQDICGALLEFVGTFFFFSIAYGTVQAVIAEGGVGPAAPTALNVFVISTCFGFSLLVSAWLFYRVTGGQFNPNVSLALLITGNLPPVRFVLYCIAQLAGSTAASAVILGLTPGPCKFNTTLAEGISPVQGVFIEMFVTAYLIFAILMLAVEKHRATPFAPVGIGLTLFVCQLWSVYFTGGAMNTARAFGPAAVTGFKDGIHWVYWVGPCLGSFLGAGLYTIMKRFNYEVLNPGQDATYKEMPAQDPALATQPTFRRQRSDPADKRSSDSMA